MFDFSWTITDGYFTPLVWWGKSLHSFRLLAACLCGLCLADIAQGQEARIWTDASGKHEIRAKFIDVVDGQVRLERPNGDISRIAVTKLSKADQEYIRQAAGEPASEPSPTAAATAGPSGLQIGDRVEAEHFGKWQLGTVTEIDYKWNDVKVRIDGESDMNWTVDVEDLRYPGTNQEPVLIKPAGPESTLKTVRPDYDDMDRLVADGQGKDRIAADPSPDLKLSWQPRSVRLPGTQDFFENPSDFEISPNGDPVALIVYANNHDEEAFPRVELIDMQKRRVVTSGPAPRGTSRLAMSPSGKRVATLPGDHPDKEDGLIHFWDINGSKIEHLIGFSPYVMNAWPNADPSWAEWLDDKHFFTVNKEGQLLLWDVEKAKAKYELLIDRGGLPTLSPGHKYLVVPTSSGVQFYDAASGEFLALLGSEDYTRAALGFSPSGRQLASAANGFIDIVDVTTGEHTRSFPYDEKAWVQEVNWIDEDYLLTDTGMLINVPLRVIAWKFEMPPRVASHTFGKTHWILVGNHQNKSQILTPLELPPPEAESAIKGLDSEELLIVKPGASVSIDVQIPEDSFLAEDVKNALRTALENAEMKVAENQPLKIVARMTHGETQQVRYHLFGRFGRDPGETVSVTNRVYDLELQQDGVTIWKRNAVHSAPHHIRMERGESIQAAIERIMKPRAENFAGRLPSYVVKPEFSEPLGSSKLLPGF